MIKEPSRIAIIQHQPDEDEGYIKQWITSRQIKNEHWLVWQEPSFKDAADFDGIIVLGGEADVKDRNSVLWMNNEIKWLKLALDNNIPCFGICLGAQLLAHVLGAKIHQLTMPEKGVLPLRINGLKNLVGLPTKQLMVNQAHSFRFDIPPGCVNYAQSDLCQQQIFINKRQNILGIQCHLEWSQSTMVNVLGDKNPSEQSAVIDQKETQLLLFKLLDFIFSDLINSDFTY